MLYKSKLYDTSHKTIKYLTILYTEKHNYTLHYHTVHSFEKLNHTALNSSGLHITEHQNTKLYPTEQNSALHSRTAREKAVPDATEHCTTQPNCKKLHRTMLYKTTRH